MARVVYLSSVGVYGDRDGAWVDEFERAGAGLAARPRRLAAEREWRAFGEERGAPVDILRLAGIYGPGRNALEKLRRGEARRIVKPGQVFNRIHVDDLAAVAVRLIEAGGPGGLWNVADEEPAPPEDVIVFAAELLGVAPPPIEDFATARLTPMARSFYDDNRRVDVGKLRRELGYRWLYPTYRDGLARLGGGGGGARDDVTARERRKMVLDRRWEVRWSAGARPLQPSPSAPIERKPIDRQRVDDPQGDHRSGGRDRPGRRAADAGERREGGAGRQTPLGRPIGMVSDGDLLGRRPEDYRREWWLEMLAGAAVPLVGVRRRSGFDG